ncbi:L-asparaginase [Eikenella sp. NML96-A-049]|uniref:asparaginase n=1 Tax=unclassified Eikenella TaxID=2639367 RepID=UPI0007DE9238|nr:MULTISPECIES: asparaginase [unclassified Eikenella]OAM34455.1 L-asparaginase [Eikenella sp. NML070372]OAM39199.1 L-asparaginase [Eikenella sp. NML96-A-049]VDH00440.1 L-asparaginase [Helicobacter pametensis]
MQKIFVLYTGGTIGMKPSPDGLVPDAELAEQALQSYAEQAVFHWHICQPLIDSSNITPQHWAEWLAILQAALPEHDGILILHGTDTLAYTANFLALALDNVGKPIILTGAQKPYHAANSDAPDNLRTAIAALQNPQLHGTVIAFGGRLYPAIGSSKCSTELDHGFDNAHFNTWQPNTPPCRLSGLPTRFNPDARVCSHLLTPGSSTEQIAHSLRHFPQEAAILLSYGQGHAPANPELLAAVQHFTQNGGLLLNISQAHHGRTGTAYAQGNALRQAGAVGGGKCNIETATALMTLAASNHWTADQLQRALAQLDLL